MSGEPASTKIRKRSYALDTHLQGRWLLLARGVWLALVALTLTIFFASLPVYLALLHTPCAGTVCEWQQLSPGQVATLTEIDLSLGAYAAIIVALTLAEVLVCVVVSTLIAWCRSDNRMALFVALMLVTFGPIMSTTAVLQSSFPWQVPNECLTFLNSTLLVLVFLLFPSGQFVPRWTGFLFVVFLVGQASIFFSAPLLPNTPVSQLGYLEFLVEAAILVVVQLYRYRRVSSPLQRQQTKWVVFGIAVPIAVLVLLTVLYLIFPVFASPGSLYPLAFNVLGTGWPLLIPLSFGFAMLRYRLWEIDLIINRTLMYGLLTVIVVGGYVLVVGILGTLLHASGNFLISLLATGLIAVLFQPLRARLQRMINRLVYGERDEPYAVLSRLGRRLKATLAPQAILPAVVETIAQALKLPYVAITLKQSHGFTTAASYGLLQDKPFILPLIYQTETIGQLLLAPRAPGDSFTPADLRLLEDIAQQAGVAAYSVRLTADLQRSRERLVTEREEERRRLRRDLHDGLGPTLASLTLTVAAAREYLTRDPATTDTLLQELASHMQGAVSDIRRLVYELRPPALDDLGLLGALRDQTARYAQGGLQITVEAPFALDALPAAAEVAVYRIGMEALTNVVRHAQARTCTLSLQQDGDLILTIRDDGCGLPVAPVMGIGVRSMRERAEELGGSCTIETLSEGGTLVVARLPLMEDVHEPSR